MVSAGEFRADLYHRLSAIEIDVPPLRDRAGDAVFLAEHFLGTDGPPLGEAARALLESHPWPGNVRELRNAIQRAEALAQAEVKPDDLGLRDPSERANDQIVVVAAAGGTVKERTHAAVLEALARHKGNRKAAARGTARPPRRSWGSAGPRSTASSARSRPRKTRPRPGRPERPGSPGVSEVSRGLPVRRNGTPDRAVAAVHMQRSGSQRETMDVARPGSNAT
jgi:hypothetical protein